MKNIDYRKQVIPIPEMENKEMIGKIVVIETIIYCQEILSSKYLRVHGSICFDLFPANPIHGTISNQLMDYEGKYLNGKHKIVYWRGKIHGIVEAMNGYKYINFRPVNYIQFIVGDELGIF